MDDKDNSWRWNILQEQLISLWVYNKSSPIASGFETFLAESFPTSCLNLSMFNQICFFLLGLINREERDKLVKWPIINIQDQAKFRKGVSQFVKDLTKQYPHFHLKRLPESYLMDPNHNQEKILDFLLELCDLAIYLSLNNPSVLIKNCRTDLTASDIETSTNIVRQARIHEEELIKKNEFPLIKFENIRMNITEKCVSLKQENSCLCSQLNKVKKNLIDNGIIGKEGKYELDDLNGINKEKINELKQINSELELYRKEAKEVLHYTKAAKDPVQLTAADLNSNSDEFDFSAVTDILDNLNLVFDFMKLKDLQVKDKEDYYRILQSVKNTLEREQSALQSFILKYSTDVNHLSNNNVSS